MTPKEDLFRTISLLERVGHTTMYMSALLRTKMWEYKEVLEKEFTEDEINALVELLDLMIELRKKIKEKGLPEKLKRIYEKINWRKIV
jgi:hypothetical protein